ncbi:MAG: hypothetical protein IPK50_08460 [Fibrobacterota bacterium]|nr:MAG: hypothetical protein IPK50_08460 [Fibrobacterota bacterium]
MKMDRDVLRLLGERLLPMGFERSAPTRFLLRSQPVSFEVHLHKFSFGNTFRVHSRICLPGESNEDRHVLNGPSSFDGWGRQRWWWITVRSFCFDFGESAASRAKSADQMHQYIRRVLLPWFWKWNDVQKLAAHKNSPLGASQKAFLRRLPS